MSSLKIMIAAAVVLAATGAVVGQATLTPDPYQVNLDPGDMTSQIFEVCIPGGGGITQADIYFLCDTTGSMGGVINQVKADAAFIVGELFDRAGVEIKIAVGNYKDFQSPDQFDPYAFQHQLNISTDETDVVNALNNWSAAGGFDTPEANLYALHQVANDDASVGWRDVSKRIIVWFGDAPGHDPVCQAISGDPHGGITTASVIADLLGNGAGGTTVIAIESVGGGGLDAAGVSGEYTAACGDSVFPGGQATAITDATGGIYTAIGNPAQVTQAILDSVDTILSEVDVSLNTLGDIDPFVDMIVPDVHEDVQIPASPDEEVCVEFEVFFKGQDCIENVNVFEGGFEARLDGIGVVQNEVTITQDECDVVICTMYLGLDQVANHIVGGDPTDMFYTVPILEWAVLMDDIPVLNIPNDPALDGLHVYLQVGMYNPFDFPSDPIQTSQGLDVEINKGVRPYGVQSGIALWLDQPPMLGGQLVPKFSVLAWED